MAQGKIDKIKIGQRYGLVGSGHWWTVVEIAGGKVTVERTIGETRGYTPSLAAVGKKVRRTVNPIRITSKPIDS